MGICGEYEFLDFQSSCIRDFWSAILPVVFVCCLCFTYIPLPQAPRLVLERLGSPLKPFLVLHEAEALGLTSEGEYEDQEGGVSTQLSTFVPLWRTLVFTFVSILESFVWISYGAYRVINEENIVWRDFLPFLVGSSWIYAAIRPIVHPAATPPYDLFALYLIYLTTSLLQIGGVIFDYSVFDIPLPPFIILVGEIGNLIAIFILLATIARIPVAIPSTKVDRDELVSGILLCRCAISFHYF